MNQKLSEDLVQEIGSAIVKDKCYNGRDWRLISIVAILGDGVTQLSGYSFDGEGSFEPDTPYNIELLGMFRNLQKAMQVPDQEPWKTCLFRIKRDPMRVRLDVDYDDPLRWKVTPATMSRVLQDIGPGSWPG